MPRFSVLTCCYNKEKFIKQCVESVIDQIYTDWELIIVDDCSTDKSYEYLSSLTDPRIKVIRNKKRLYCSSSYAIALQHADSELCGVLDGDDALVKKSIKVIAKRYKKYRDVGFIYSQFHWCDKNLGRPRQGFSAIPRRGKSLVDMALGGKHCFSHWRTFRRNIADKTVIFPDGLQVSVDKNMGFALEEVSKGAYLPRSLYMYRYYKANMSKTLAMDQKLTTIRLAKERKKHRSKNGIVPYPIIQIE